jgi:TatD DNase family protein
MVSQWIDTHAHLDSAKYEHDRVDVIARAQAAGVWPIVTIGADLASSRAAVALAEQYEGLYATVGVHPHSASSADTATMDELEDLARHPRVVAVGEVGLDYYYEFSPRGKQREVLEAQLALAEEAGKPVVVHLRDKRGAIDAYTLAVEVLSEWVGRRRANLSANPGRCVPGVLHCYSGTLEVARSMVALGFYLGIDGPVTYPNARALQAMVAVLPLERLVLETDCPYLAPQTRRGKRNEPAYLPYIGEQVAELQQAKVEEVAQVTCENAARLFGLRASNGDAARE